VFDEYAVSNFQDQNEPYCTGAVAMRHAFLRVLGTKCCLTVWRHGEASLCFRRYLRRKKKRTLYIGTKSVCPSVHLHVTWYQSLNRLIFTKISTGFIYRFVDQMRASWKLAIWQSCLTYRRKNVCPPVTTSYPIWVKFDIGILNVTDFERFSISWIRSTEIYNLP